MLRARSYAQGPARGKQDIFHSFHLMEFQKGLPVTLKDARKTTQVKSRREEWEMALELLPPSDHM